MEASTYDSPDVFVRGLNSVCLEWRTKASAATWFEHFAAANPGGDTCNLALTKPWLERI